MNSTNTMKAGLMALAMQLGIAASAQAGGAALLQLPLEGVTAKNREQCAKLFREQFSGVLAGWDKASKSRNVTMLRDGATNVVQIHIGRGHVSLGEVEKALVGSPFSINREELEYISIVTLRIGKIADHEKFVNALAALGGKRMHARTVEDKDGSLLITLQAPGNKLMKGTKVPLFTHQRLTGYLSKNKVKLIAISWGTNVHRGAPFGARRAAAAVART